MNPSTKQTIYNKKRSTTHTQSTTKQTSIQPQFGYHSNHNKRNRIMVKEGWKEEEEGMEKGMEEGGK
jgi:hypothetical protein